MSLLGLAFVLSLVIRSIYPKSQRRLKDYLGVSLATLIAIIALILLKQQ